MSKPPKPWHEMTDQEKSDDIQRSVDHHAKHGTDFGGRPPTPQRLASQAIKVVSDTLRAQLLEGGDAIATYAALVQRGVAEEVAFDVMGKALYCCMFEVTQGGADRWVQVMRGLREGRTLTELFPDGLYEGGGERA
ncbi:hypothetical protein [Bradyrhizobium sp. Mp64]|uniref:hypothetical protein n=1 Tax=Bradyrhizobium sp. Mp64 TaxID=3042158 RepID=UPI00248B1437|nr:hypothetical protein [Bradyrhizobium sp. Mp64]MDI2103948.1 hypothetical protein [Bradyrhizobium sp. Mp64]